MLVIKTNWFTSIIIFYFESRDIDLRFTGSLFKAHDAYLYK